MTSIEKKNLLNRLEHLIEKTTKSIKDKEHPTTIIGEVITEVRTLQKAVETDNLSGFSLIINSQEKA